MGCNSLVEANKSPVGITYEKAEDQEWLWVVDIHGLFRYTMDRVGSTNRFGFVNDNERPVGITYANDLLYVVDSRADTVYVYRYDEDEEEWYYYSDKFFALHADNSGPTGITYANNRLYVVDIEQDKVYVYGSPSLAEWSNYENENFALHADNSSPSGITYANNRLYVVDFQGGGIYDYDIPTIDLIVESPSVSESILAVGQSFTLSAIVRNRGTAQAATTTLRYYRSTNATISTRDEEVGSGQHS